MTTNSADGRVPAPCPRVSVEELARRKGVRPIESFDDMARDVLAADEELDEFLTFVRSERQAGSRSRCGPSSWIPTFRPRSSRTG